jgi:uncharacterized protein
MAGNKDYEEQLPVVLRREDFDVRSGNWLERLIFNHRVWVILICAVASILLGFQATKLKINASFEGMIPQSHPYIRNYLENKDALRGLGNSLRIVVENPKGSIYNAEYLAQLREINDKLFLMPGVDRSWMKSLWTPLVRWTEITEEGFQGGPVMPDRFDGSPDRIEALRRNVQRAGLVGNLVSNDAKSSMIIVPLMDRDNDTGKALDYSEFSRDLDKMIVVEEAKGVKIHVIGFAKLVGDLIAGLRQVFTFFAVAVLIATGIMFWYTRCWRSTAILVGCALLSVVWLLGLMEFAGFVIDPYSILVPFLIFAIGLSHGAQKMNGIMQDVGRGTHKYVAARYTFRRLFLAGLTALLTNVVGFAVLMVIDIPVIRELALTTSLGVCILIFTKLVLVPVTLSYTGVSERAAARSVKSERGEAAGEARGFGALWVMLDRFTTARWATVAIVLAGVMAAGGYAVSRHVQTGDLDPGAPELRANSRYNRDNAYITQHYGLSSDQFAVVVKTPPGGCRTFETLTEQDRLSMLLSETPGVQTVTSAASLVRFITAGNNEGNPKWLSINRSPQVIAPALGQVVTNYPELSNVDCAIAPVVAYLKDHRAATLERVVQVVEDFSATHDTTDRHFLLAAGSAGIEAVTNIVVARANRTMLFLLYGAVTLLCFITFRSWRAVVVALIPLMITSVLCEALMVALGIGIKVATLPVIALGVGVGVDYALYLLSIQLSLQRKGVPLTVAYRRALQFTGKVVALVALTLGAGVLTWAWSPIKFQADMGILLTFMFLWNMIGALVMIPALSWLLLRKPFANASEDTRLEAELQAVRSGRPGSTTS